MRRTDSEARVDRVEGVSSWLMEGDPAVRWQVMRDLLGCSAKEVADERARVATDGWCAQLLAMQDSDGTWAGALYSPKWTSTTYTLLLLQRLGLESGHPQALAGCRLLWDSAKWFDGGLNLAKTIREPETCITAMLVFLAASYGLDDDRVDSVVEWLLTEQLDDGGWNCKSIRSGSTHGSFHTTISVLEALDAYRRARGEVAVANALGVGRDFFLEHRLYRSHRTGDIVDAEPDAATAGGRRSPAIRVEKGFTSTSGSKPSGSFTMSAGSLGHGTTSASGSSVSTDFVSGIQRESTFWAVSIDRMCRSRAVQHSPQRCCYEL